MRSPIYQQKSNISAFTPTNKPQPHKRQSSQIQYSDLTNIPPKLYNPKPLKAYQKTAKPMYRNDKVVNDDYHRVLSEYRTIEEQDQKKQPINHLNKIKQVSLKPPREKSKKNADPLKLGKDELPDQILEQIEKLIRAKLQKITPDIIQSLKQEQDQKKKGDKVIVEEKDEEDSEGQNDDQEQESNQVQLDPVSEWQVRKEIENKLRKELQKEALGLLKLQKQQQSEIKEKYEIEKQKRLAQWEKEKDKQKKKEKMIQKSAQKQKQQEKENKKEMSKQAFQQWMNDYCNKLKEQKIKEQQKIEKKQKDMQIKQRLIYLKRKMCDKAFDEWKRKKEEEERTKKMTAQELEEELDRDEDVDYNANFKQFVDSLVNEHIKAHHPEYVKPEQELYNTPQQQKLVKLDQITNKKFKKSNSNEKKRSKKKFTKKMILGQDEKKQGQDSEFERISEKKSSSEQSYEGKKEYQELSSIQKNNASQPVGADSVESIVSGMESQQKIGSKK